MKGDALLCMFFGNEPLPILTLRAVQCGLDIQTDLKSYTALSINLSLHIGVLEIFYFFKLISAVAAGEINSLLVGGVNGQWEWLVTGSCLRFQAYESRFNFFRQLETAVEASKEGEVVASSAAWKLVKRYCSGVCKKKPDYHIIKVKHPVDIIEYKQPILDSSIEPAIRCHIQPSVQKNLDSGSVSFMAELRTITVLFVNLNTLSLGSAKKSWSFKKDQAKDTLPHMKIHNALVVMQSILFQLGGVVRQFIVGKKVN